MLRNFDLFSVGIAIAGIGILGFVVFFNNRKSITNKTFLIFALVATFWSISNYLIYQFENPEIILWITRSHMFFSTWYSFFIFQLFYAFPNEIIKFPKLFKKVLIPITFLVSVLTLTPLVLSKVTDSSRGGVAVITPGPGIIIFGVTVISLILCGIVVLARKVKKVQKLEKVQYRFILMGAAFTFSLHLAFNFILPIVFTNPRFVPLGAIFTFPFVALTSYAIIRHHLLNVKVITTEIIAFILPVVTLYEIILAEDVLTRILRFGVFCLILAFGILLIRSVRKEVEQREKLQELTGQLTVAKMDLENANARLTELDKLKSEFLSFASHQVKSPMAVIKGFAQLIADGSYGQVSDEAKAKAIKIKESTDRTIALVNNLLDLRKIEEGKMEFKFESIDIVELVRGMTEELKIIAAPKGLDLQFESAASSLRIKADVQKIRQVIQNLLDNSIKYTEKGFIRVKVDEAGDYALVSITDSGRGMSQELQKKLFGQFIRDEKTKTEIQGTGLGLYIAKQIVTAHNGQIWAESDGEGHGSRFYVRLAKN